jgi:AcrR family transcriptional regulator
MMQKQILQTLFTLILEKGWKAVSLEEVARVSEVPLPELLFILPSKEQVFPVWAEFTENELLAHLSVESIATYPEKERLMEILLTKIELMTPFKSFLTYLRSNFLAETDMSLPFALAEMASLDRILDHYGFKGASLINEIKRKGLFGIYLLTLDTWLQDDSHDLGPTLAKLDNLLTKGETFLERYA